MSGGSDKGKGKKEERHSTRKGAGTINKFTYKELGTGGGTKIALRGTPITISSDEEEYEDVASPTMAVEPPGTPIGVPFDSATGKGKRFIFADYEEEEEEDLYVRDVLGGSVVVEPPTMTVEPTPPRQPEVYLTGNHEVPDVGLGTTVVAPPMSVVEPTTTAVIPPGVVRTTIAAFQAVAAGGSAVEAPTTVVEARTTVVVATQTDPMEFPFVFPVPKGEKWWI
jgi:hypothetical protein